MGIANTQVFDDIDADSILDEHDNCANTANLDQVDVDNNGIGDMERRVNPFAFRSLRRRATWGIFAYESKSALFKRSGC